MPQAPPSQRVLHALDPHAQMKFSLLMTVLDTRSSSLIQLTWRPDRDAAAAACDGGAVFGRCGRACGPACEGACAMSAAACFVAFLRRNRGRLRIAFFADTGKLIAGLCQPDAAVVGEIGLDIEILLLQN